MLDSRNSQGGGGGGYGQGGGGYNQDSGGYGQGGGNVTQGRSQSASMQEGPADNFDLDDEIPF
jgi:single-strand DNA-binding protein